MFCSGMDDDDDDMYTCVVFVLCVSVPFKLQEGEVRIISVSQCQSYFDNKTITSRMLCAGYEAGTIDSCMVSMRCPQGDLAV